MKKLAILASAILATSAFATSPGGGGGKCFECPEINIDGRSTQTVSATSSLFKNTAEGHDAYAHQNVSSNSGNVDVMRGGVSQQTTRATNSTVSNKADGEDAYASQNVSSNIGDVDIRGTSIQMTSLVNSTVMNVANKKTKAVQNLASNNGCVSCQ